MLLLHTNQKQANLYLYSLPLDGISLVVCDSSPKSITLTITTGRALIATNNFGVNLYCVVLAINRGELFDKELQFAIGNQAYIGQMFFISAHRFTKVTINSLWCDNEVLLS